jgi:hypothetical protein
MYGWRVVAHVRLDSSVALSVGAVIIKLKTFLRGTGHRSHVSTVNLRSLPRQLPTIPLDERDPGAEATPPSTCASC